MVLDASAAIELLLHTAAGQAVAKRLDDIRVIIHAPHLIDVEIAQVLRRYANRGILSEARTAFALGRWRDLDVERHPHEPYLERIWQLRDNLTAYDAVYVALAEVLSTPLVTADRKLAGAPGLRAVIELV
jgi:predicted nucleic acid-binding protein